MLDSKDFSLSPLSRALLISVALAVLSGQIALAEPTTQRELLLASGERLAASLSALDDGILTLTTEEGVRELPLDNLVRWGAIAERAARPTVLLRDGGVLVGAPAWTRGGSVGLVEDQWQIKNATFRNATLPREGAQAIWLSAAGEGPLNDGVRSASAAYNGAEDRVWLVSGDTLDGQLVKLQDRVLTFETAGEAIEIESERVAAIALAGKPTKPAGRLAIGLEDGTLLYASQASMTPDSLSVTLASGEQLLGGSGRAVSFVQSLSPAILYLSDLAPLDYQHTPCLSVDWPLSVDHGLTGQRLEAGGRPYLKGLAMHSASRVVYRIEGDWRRFEAELAIDHSSGSAEPGGSVTFRVLVARESGFEPAYESPILRSGDKPLPISVDVSGAKAIALLVDFADYGDQQDHADWLDARLVK